MPASQRSAAKMMNRLISIAKPAAELLNVGRELPVRLLPYIS